MSSIVFVAVAAALFAAIVGMRVWSPATLERHPGAIPLSLGILVVGVGGLCLRYLPTPIVAAVLISGFLLMGYGFRRDRA
jgi:hypothetical protein